MTADARVGTDLDLLAKWTRRFYGSGAPMDGGGGSGGIREEREDERSGEFHRVAVIHRRFESMRQGDGRRSYSVLWLLYIERGPATRTKWGDVMAYIGRALASKERRAEWHVLAKGRRALVDGFARKHGEALYDAAVRAYCEAIEREERAA